MSLPSLLQAADNTRVQWESLLPPTKAGLSSTSGLIFVNRTHFSPLCIGPDSLSTALYRSAFSPPRQKCWRCVIHSHGCAEIITWSHRGRHQIDGSTRVIGPRGGLTLFVYREIKNEMKRCCVKASTYSSPILR